MGTPLLNSIVTAEKLLILSSDRWYLKQGVITIAAVLSIREQFEPAGNVKNVIIFCNLNFHSIAFLVEADWLTCRFLRRSICDIIPDKSRAWKSWDKINWFGYNSVIWTLRYIILVISDRSSSQESSYPESTEWTRVPVWEEIDSEERKFGAGDAENLLFFV